MGSFDGVEVCELVDLYLLNILKSEFGGNNIGFYRDDGLSCFEKSLNLSWKKSKRRYGKF